MMDHRSYVGSSGEFDRMGKWQFDYVTPKITKKTRFLDLGCGSMRLGKHLIPWLNKGKYIGLDRNQQMIDAGIQKELQPNTVEKKAPQYVATTTWDMSNIKPVDFVWAQAVFNHINIESIQACLRELKNVMHSNSVFYFTYWPGVYNPQADDTYTMSKINVYKTPEQMSETFAEFGFTLEHTEEKTILGQSISRATL